MKRYALAVAAVLYTASSSCARPQHASEPSAGVDSDDLVVDESFDKTQGEVANSIDMRLRGRELGIHLRDGARWNSLTNAVAGASGAHVGSVRIETNGGQSSLELPLHQQRKAKGWLVLSIGVEPAAVEARLWPSDAQPRPAVRLPPKAFDRWANANCGSGRCPELLVFADPAYSAVDVMRILKLVFDAWPEPGRPNVRLYSGAPTMPERAPGIGALPTELIQQVVRSHTQDVSRCYGDSRSRRARPEVVVRPRFQIAASGEVAWVKRDEEGHRPSEETAPEVVACVLRVFKRMRFPVPEAGGPFEVIYPIHVTPY